MCLSLPIKAVFPTFAAMKRMVWIGIVVFLVVAACNRPDIDLVETRRATSRIEQVPEPAVPEDHRRVEGPSHELSAIDSLMWRQPDSALACLIPYFDTCCRDAKFCVSTTTTFNRHYANLLLSELLYKNDYPQTNRPALLQAVTYFDSLSLNLNDTPAPKRLIAGTDPLSLIRNDNLVFLDARAHYINGVGYYENDSIVPACAEYLKALELMENRFDEKDLVGKKARFMTYTYNRLGEMFSEQYIMESAILCYKEAQVFCEIEPTSPQGISNNYYRIGIQYNKMGDKDTAMYYYDKALENLEDSNCLMYRNIKSNKALLCYQISKDAESAVQELITIAQQSEDENERLTRYFTIGDILYEEGNYDSAKLYLERVYEQKDDEISRIQVAEYLRNVYENMGDMEKADAFVRFLADHKKLDDENKPLVSKLKDMFQTHLNQKQEKQAEEVREKSVRKTIGIIVPIAVLLAFVIIVMARLKRKKQLKEQQEEADRKLGETERKHKAVLTQHKEELRKAFEEAKKQHELTLQQQQSETETLLEEKDRQLEKERKARQREKEKLQQGLQLREEQVSALEKALGQQREEAELRREAFMNEAICCKINDSIRSLRITARNSHEKYVSFTEEDAAALKAAVLKHYGNFESVLLGKYPKMGNDDLQICQLYLMGLDERQIAVLQNKSYSAIKKRANSLKNLLGLDENLQAYILKFPFFQET